jgi:hypothetical protein
MTYTPTRRVIIATKENAKGALPMESGKPLTWPVPSHTAALPDASHDARLVSVHHNRAGTIIAAVYIDKYGRGMNVWHRRSHWTYVTRKPGKDGVPVSALHDYIFAEQPDTNDLAELATCESAIVGSVQLLTANDVEALTELCRKNAAKALERMSA